MRILLFVDLPLTEMTEIEIERGTGIEIDDLLQGEAVEADTPLRLLEDVGLGPQRKRDIETNDGPSPDQNLQREERKGMRGDAQDLVLGKRIATGMNDVENLMLRIEI